MSAPMLEDKEYERAVVALNGLQTNASVLEQIKRDRKEGRHKPRDPELTKIRQSLERTGLKVEELERMNAIHVTGTKGKGSVCAMCESILRAHGLKTGFYSSPHLLEVRERIRLNGRPLEKKMFSAYFWDCYDKLSSTKDQYEGCMPAYFRFLTVMAFNVFLKEKVDVAVVEVGIGGTFDSTNIMRKPVVSVITSLGYDHTSVLGDTLAKIAWQKGGICKPDRPAFTLPQLAEPMKALAERAQEMKARSFQVAPNLTSYPGEKPVLGVAGDHQMYNASLAIQACRSWLQEMGRWGKVNGTPCSETLHGVPVASPFHLPPEFHTGLKSCRWAGRAQVLSRPGITYYLDGGHTPHSVKACADWFTKTATEEAETIKAPVVRVLLFNTTRGRNARTHLQPLLGCGLEYALFCPNIADVDAMNSADQTNLMETTERQCAKCEENSRAWLELTQHPVPRGNETKPTNDSASSSHQTPSAPLGDGHVTSERNHVFQSVSQALQWASWGRDSFLPPPLSSPAPFPVATHVQLLVTGSLHLVGTVMGVLGLTIEDV